MTDIQREIEVKYFVSDLTPFREMLLSQGAQLSSDRYFERNIRFDTHDLQLAENQSILRIREDRSSRITFKHVLTDFNERQEIEIEVDDSIHAQHLFEALGFEVTAAYEKYRQIYRLGDVDVMLDELPFGSFIELEGPSLGRLREMSKKLHLSWDRRVMKSYLDIFQDLRERLDLPFTDATFANFTNLQEVRPEEMGVENAFQNE
ncbi:MAG: class IV adenylate cyclase [Anaerolineales bacterium]|nr:class IV adenylate cyclase [Anaerolineales bacterium]